jgi:hypothetical protein
MHNPGLSGDIADLTGEIIMQGIGCIAYGKQAFTAHPPSLYGPPGRTGNESVYSFKKSSGGKNAWIEEREECYSCRRPADLFLR